MGGERMIDNTLFDGKYRILKILGSGGMGSVYLAENVKLNTLWAVKEINKNANSQVDFLAEPNILKKLNHHALPRIFDILETDDNIYIIEDFVDGITLEEKLKKTKRIPEKQIIEWAKQICEVLLYLHTLKPNPIIYRDMKPSNIMLTKEGKIKLIDFGIAREYKKESKSDTTYIGTKGYAAPEQYGTSQTDSRTDIYSLGITLYHLITGKSPNEPPYEIKPVRHFNSKLSRGIEVIIGKCTKQDPRQRYQSMKKLLFDLNNIEKFNSEFRKKALLRDIKTAVRILLLVVFSYLIYGGILQIDKEKVAAYDLVIQSGISYANEKQYDKAVEVLKDAANKIPEKVEAYRETAYVYLTQYNYDKCIDYLKNDVLNIVEASRLDADIIYILGTAYYEKKDYKNAVFYFEKATVIEQSHVNFYRDLAVCHAKLGNLDEAEMVLNEIKSKGMAEEASFYVEGEILSAKKQYNEAIKSFHNSLNIVKDDKLKEKTFIAIAEIYRDNKSEINNAIDQEISILEKALSETKDKNNIIFTEMLAEAYYDKGIAISKNKNEFFKKSVQKFEVLITLGYERPYIYRNIAIIYQNIGDFKKSEEVLHTMKSVYSDDYRCYFQLALLYADMENKKANELRNYDKTYDNYKIAVKYAPEGEKTSDLIPLVNMINELKEKKWIK